ncbi:T9SS type A sorting domain-containing protein [Lacinutrix neustonica]|uniref:T9SS type A sorting domain-containing protein n=1 Tax=Lacinutrix neustonica TaxID=2980107 RepID=A0A9E8MVG1_9FLAO|nr:T9SS type A sorting domain-containing protein [Lacinutrix neustonica]WAC01004.1 T9SS type A sorting domain-containing protein [Lacinutrix neustonica]
MGKTLLTYVITIEPKVTPIGSWEIIINALTGEVLSARDKAYYYNGEDEKQGNKRHRKEFIKRKKSTVNGSGFVYETDPLTATLNVYGGQYVDANDATNPALDAARSSVTLLDITQTGGEFFLTGPYAEIQDFEAPNKGVFSQGTSVFNFNRNQDAFEAVNVYYHIDKSMRYYNETLGLNVKPYQYNSGVRVDPSGLSGADNSHYLPGSGRLAFGEGCVDDAEDADVIIHELGHGIHDWITNGATSAYLGEGNGDYLAASYKRSFAQWSPSDASYDFMFGWDGNNPCWPGRTTADTRSYPNGLIGLQGGAAHFDGEMWSSTLMEIWDIIGREKTDKAFIEGIAMTNSNTNQEQAAIAVRQAAIDMGVAGGYTCEDIQVFTDRFTARGYNLPTYTCTLSVAAFETKPIVMFPNPTKGALTFKNLTETYNISVFNMLGQKIKNHTLSTSQNSLDVSHFASGTYFIKFYGADTVLKFVKQ